MNINSPIKNRVLPKDGLCVRCHEVPHKYWLKNSEAVCKLCILRSEYPDKADWTLDQFETWSEENRIKLSKNTNRFNMGSFIGFATPT